MRLYKITFNNRSWQTTSPANAWGFILFLANRKTIESKDELKKHGVGLKSKWTFGPEIPSVIVG